MLSVTGKEKKGTDTLECKRCCQQTLGDRRFDGVAVNRAKKVIYTFEFKRTSDREHGYVQRCDERATEQYAGCLLYTSPSPRDLSTSRMPSSA